MHASSCFMLITHVFLIQFEFLLLISIDKKTMENSNIHYNWRTKNYKHRGHVSNTSRPQSSFCLNISKCFLHTFRKYRPHMLQEVNELNFHNTGEQNVPTFFWHGELLSLYNFILVSYR